MILGAILTRIPQNETISHRIYDIIIFTNSSCTMYCMSSTSYANIILKIYCAILNNSKYMIVLLYVSSSSILHRKHKTFYQKSPEPSTSLPLDEALSCRNPVFLVNQCPDSLFPRALSAAVY